jgi:hypothetical protein
MNKEAELSSKATLFTTKIVFCHHNDDTFTNIFFFQNVWIESLREYEFHHSLCCFHYSETRAKEEQIPYLLKNTIPVYLILCYGVAVKQKKILENKMVTYNLLYLCCYA